MYQKKPHAFHTITAYMSFLMGKKEEEEKETGTG